MSRVKIRELALIAAAGGMLVFEVMGFRGALPAASVATAAVARGASHAATRAAVGVAKGTASWLGIARAARPEILPIPAANRDRHRSAHPRLRVVTASLLWCPAADASRSLLHAHAVRNAYTVVLREVAL